LGDNPEYCTLSTAELPSGRVSSRIVQLKGLEQDGAFIFFTNVESSRKTHDLATNSHASLVFYWGALQRQVRIEGKVAYYNAEEKLEFFASTSRQSRIASWAPQSSVMPIVNTNDDGRTQLDEWLAATNKRFPASEDVLMAPSWNVLRLVPAQVEFWQAGRSRLHDRFLYERHDGENGAEYQWKLARLWP
jgi:pyridoxamine 5'-phosphate oxidase